jgi:hypothetical protein
MSGKCMVEVRFFGDLAQTEEGELKSLGWWAKVKATATSTWDNCVKVVGGHCASFEGHTRSSWEASSPRTCVTRGFPFHSYSHCHCLPHQSPTGNSLGPHQGRNGSAAPLCLSCLLYPIWALVLVVIYIEKP